MLSTKCVNVIIDGTGPSIILRSISYDILTLDSEIANEPRHVISTNVVF